MGLSSFCLIFLCTIYIDHLNMEESLLKVWEDGEKLNHKMQNSNNNTTTTNQEVVQSFDLSHPTPLAIFLSQFQIDTNIVAIVLLQCSPALLHPKFLFFFFLMQNNVRMCFFSQIITFGFHYPQPKYHDFFLQSEFSKKNDDIMMCFFSRWLQR